MSSLAPPPMATTSRRLHSLDALRGFDMFWIVGGSSFVAAVAETTDNGVVRAIEAQTHHVEWNGFSLWDLIFPLFLFIAGAALPYSLAARRAAGDSRRTMATKIVRRGASLVLLGLVYNGLFTFDFANLRCASVLGRIGLGYLGAGLIVVFAPSARAWFAWALGILVVYCLAMSLIPVPGFGAGNMTPGATLADYVDRILLPGRLHHGDRDPEGLLSTVPAIATALFGALAGTFLRANETRGTKGQSIALRLFAFGVLGLALGSLWGRFFPINKNLWTSSFVLWTSGLSAILLASFYLVIDVWHHERWAFFFIVLGQNAITIYLLNRFVDFEGLAHVIFARGEHALHPAVYPALAILMRWAMLYGMYRKKIFLRV